MDFGLAIIVSREITKTHIIRDLSDDINKYFNNKDYGDGIKQFAIGIICVSQGFEQFYRNKKPKYTKDKKVINSEGFIYEIEKCLEYSIKLDYELFKNASEEDAKKILAREILSSFSTLDTMKKKIKDFDWERFEKDVAHYFKKQDLI